MPFREFKNTSGFQFSLYQPEESFDRTPIYYHDASVYIVDLITSKLLTMQLPNRVMKFQIFFALNPDNDEEFEIKRRSVLKRGPDLLEPKHTQN